MGTARWEAALPFRERRPDRGWARDLLQFCARKPLGTVGAIIIGVMAVMALTAPLLVAHDPDAIGAGARLSPPLQGHFLGTDYLGRDIWSRLVYGSRVSLIVGLAASLLGATLGALLGLCSGYFSGQVDNVIQRVMDTLMAFPMLILAIAIIAALGASLTNVILAICLPVVPRAARVVRSAALGIKSTYYVDAARALGCSHRAILFRHILPNCMAPYLVIATAQLGHAVLSEAALSYLGLGIPPPAPSWGGMLTGGAANFFEVAPWTAFFPGTAIALAVFAFNLFGDALRDAWDPKLRQT